jgi:hypothetical protein
MRGRGEKHRHFLKCERMDIGMRIELGDCWFWIGQIDQTDQRKSSGEER